MSNIEYGYCHCGCGNKTKIEDHNNVNRKQVKGEPKRFILYHYKKQNIEDTFWDKVTKTNYCWEWNKSKDRSGYGKVLKGSLAHRVAWTLINGVIPDGLCVLHKCDNPSCVNPDHLFLGTQYDNMRDMFSKGRQQNNKGEKNNIAKLNTEQVLKIRELLGSNVDRKHIASIYGVCVASIAHISTRRTWSHI